MRQTEKTGVLLVNLGTPASWQTADVRRYLRQFLSDPRVLDINPLGRLLLLYLIILPFRPAKSGAAYKSIWTDQGSPLMVHSVNLHAQLQARMPDREVVLAMRYGEPSIEAGLQKLMEKQVDRVVVAPLYPQYAASTTGTVLAEVFRAASGPWNTPNLQSLPPFYREPAYLDAMAAVYRRSIEGFDPDFVLFSYHGVPVRHVQKSDPTGQHCYKPSASCCAAMCHANHHCYRAQCYETTRQLLPRFGLSEENTMTSFQSRLGRDPWIEPYTDQTIERLAKERGVKRLAVLCPAFVADCLETLEEIGMEAKEEFLHAGGEEFRLIPCLNAEPEWADALAALLRPL
jgi:ferrochelatase